MPSPANLADLECNLEQLAALVGVTPRHCRRFLADAPKTARGRWALGDALPAILERLSGGSAGGDLTKERTRLTSLQADRAALQLAKEKGEVATLADFQRAQSKVMAIIRANMLQVPARTSMQIVAESDESRIKAVLSNEIRHALKQASEADLQPEEIENDDNWTDDEPGPDGEP